MNWQPKGSPQGSEPNPVPRRPDSWPPQDPSEPLEETTGTPAYTRTNARHRASVDGRTRRLSDPRPRYTSRRSAVKNASHGPVGAEGAHGRSARETRHYDAQKRRYERPIPPAHVTYSEIPPSAQKAEPVQPSHRTSSAQPTRHATPRHTTPPTHRSGSGVHTDRTQAPPRAAQPTVAEPSAPRRRWGKRRAERAAVPPVTTSEASGSLTMKGGRIDGLDGLRAIAILSVLLFHISPELLPGGFIGVDVFFVVSGFLITTLLLREKQRKGAVDLARFWIRRARRLLPALITTILVVIPFAWVFSLFSDRGHDLLIRIDQQVLGALTFSYNWVEIAAGSDYFTSKIPQLLTNFWSLAVEEQFYLFWPWIFLFLVSRPWTRRGIALGLLCVSLLSIGLMASLSPFDVTRVYYGTDTHIFGLMFGAALAFEASRQDGGILTTLWFKRFAPLVSILSIGVLLALMWIVQEGHPFAFNGGLGLASLATTALISSFLPHRNQLVQLMDSPAAVWVGDRSYALYLWHWPILVLGLAMFPASDFSVAWWINRILAVALTFLICDLSLKYLETPIRVNGFRGTARIMARRVSYGHMRPVWAAALIPVLLGGMTGYAMATAPQTSKVQEAIEANSDLVSEGPASTKSGSGSVDKTGAKGKDGKSESDKKDSKDPNAVKVNYAIPRGDEVTIFGDSMSVGSAPALLERFPGADIIAKSSRRYEEAIPIMDQMNQDGQIRRAVVIALGTNWGIQSPEEIRKAIYRVAEGRTVVLVNTHGAGWEPGVTEHLNSFAKGHPNITVADWDSVAKQHEAGLQADGIHPGFDTMKYYADVIYQGFERLAQNAPEGSKPSSTPVPPAGEAAPGNPTDAPQYRPDAQADQRRAPAPA